VVSFSRAIGASGMYFDAQASITRAAYEQRRHRQQVVGIVERDQSSSDA